MVIWARWHRHNARKRLSEKQSEQTADARVARRRGHVVEQTVPTAAQRCASDTVTAGGGRATSGMVSCGVYPGVAQPDNKKAYSWLNVLPTCFSW